MARNFTLSKRGWVGSSASSRTRRLKSSQLSSRLMNNLGSSSEVMFLRSSSISSLFDCREFSECTMRNAHPYILISLGDIIFPRDANDIEVGVCRIAVTSPVDHVNGNHSRPRSTTPWSKVYIQFQYKVRVQAGVAKLGQRRKIQGLILSGSGVQIPSPALLFLLSTYRGPPLILSDFLRILPLPRWNF